MCESRVRSGIDAGGGEGGSGVTNDADGTAITVANGGADAELSVTGNGAEASATTTDGLHKHHRRGGTSGDQVTLDINENGLFDGYNIAGSELASLRHEDIAGSCDAVGAGEVEAAECGVAADIAGKTTTATDGLDDKTRGGVTGGLECAGHVGGNGSTSGTKG